MMLGALWSSRTGFESAKTGGNTPGITFGVDETGNEGLLDGVDGDGVVDELDPAVACRYSSERLFSTRIGVVRVVVQFAGVAVSQTVIVNV